MKRLIVLGAALTLLAQAACDEKPPAVAENQHQGAPAPALDPPKGREVDWTRALAFRPLRGQLPGNGDFCKELLRFDIASGRFLYASDSRAIDLKIPEVEPEPRGYSNVSHDTCSATVTTDDSPRNAEVPWAEYRRPDPEKVRQLLNSGSTIYWMSERGEACVPVRVERTKRPTFRERRDPERSNSGLGAFASINVPEGALWGRLVPPLEDGTYIPFAAVLPEEGSHGYLFMGTWQKRTHQPHFKCQCERLLRFMHVDDERIEMLPRRFSTDPTTRDSAAREVPTSPVEVRFYSLAEVENWFLRREHCETARTAALLQIKTDGRKTVSSGFYSGYSGFESR